MKIVCTQSLQSCSILWNPVDCSLPGSSLTRNQSYVQEPYGASLVAQRVKRLRTMQEIWVRSLVGKIPWRRKWQPTPILLPEKSHGWRSLVGYSPWGRKESDTIEQLYFPFSLSSVGSSPRLGLPRQRSSKESACQYKRHTTCEFNPWVRKIPGIGNGNPLQYSCLEISIDRGA